MTANTPIFTLGYGNRHILNFIELLVQNKITTVVDIRTRPYSRFQTSYNKAKLETTLQSEGFNYLFRGEWLGGKPANQMYYVGGKLNYSLLAATREYQTAIADLITMAELGEILCLLCCELDENMCHRKTLVAESLYKRGIAVNHITKEGSIQPHVNCSPALHLF